MAKKRRGRKMPAWRKWAKAAVGILGKGLGIVVAAGPVIEEAQLKLPGGDFTGFVNAIGYRYSAGYGKDFAIGVNTYARLAAGLIVMVAFSALAKRV